MPEHIINQIKAGEVVERPSALLKELLENSLDALASYIAVEILDNGLNLIKVTDNGKGMSYEDLPWAFSRHATSKLHCFEDLYQLSSFGFRGEALASASSISKITCLSFQKGKRGGRIQLEGGKILTHLPLSEGSGEEEGTTLVVQDLFFNTPVRLKFLQSKLSEKIALEKVITSYLLAYPQVGFSIKWDESEPKVYSPEESLKRIQEVLYPTNSLSQKYEWHHVSGDYDHYHFHGHIIFRQQSKRGKHQYLFVNHRPITDKTIHLSIIKMIEHQIFGQNNGDEGIDYILFLQVPADEIDVNIHPSKTTVKFENSAIVFSLFKSTFSQIRREIRKVAVKNMQSILQEKKSYVPDNFLSDGKDKENFQILTILGNMALVEEWSEQKGENSYYSLHLQMAYHSLSSLLLDETRLERLESSPLLVSYPLEVEKNYAERIISLLSNFGWEFNYEEKSRILLVQAIPGEYEILSYRPFLIALFDFFKKNEKFSFPLWLKFRPDYQLNLIGKDSWNSLILQHKKRWMNEKILVEINDKYLSSCHLSQIEGAIQ